MNKMKCSTALGGDLLYRISPKLVSKCAKSGQKFVHAPTSSTTLIGSFFTKLILAQ